MIKILSSALKNLFTLYTEKCYYKLINRFNKKGEIVNAELAPIIKVYHCNSEEKCNDFIIRKKLIESNHPYDSFWLGKGMYFWDNLGNAKYWRKEKLKKNKSQNLKIICCFVSLEKVLDLTDSEEIELIHKLWKEIDVEPNLNINKKKKTKIGDKLNFIYDFFPEFIKNYNIIKTIGENYKHNDIFFDNKNFNGVKPGISSKVIYNVKNMSCVMNSGRVVKDE